MDEKNYSQIPTIGTLASDPMNAEFTVTEGELSATGFASYTASIILTGSGGIVYKGITQTPKIADKIGLDKLSLEHWNGYTWESIASTSNYDTNTASHVYSRSYSPTKGDYYRTGTAHMATYGGQTYRVNASSEYIQA